MTGVAGEPAWGSPSRGAAGAAAPGRPTLGIDLGGTKLLAGVIGSDGGLLHRSTAPSAGLDQKGVLAALEREIRVAIDACPGLAAAGLGVPCTIDRAAGRCVNAVNLPIRDLPVARILSERTGIPVELDNDANLAALAEHRIGAGRGSENLVLLTIGTGIGGGLILGGRPFRGSNGSGAELGHVVVDVNGPPCQGSCPNHGCIESIASGTALAREARALAAASPRSELGRAAHAGEEINGELVTALARGGDEPAREALAMIGRRLGAALSGLANTFAPDVLLIGGGVSAAGELLLGPARSELRARALPPQNETPLEVAQLGADAGMIGGALLAREALGEGAA